MRLRLTAIPWAWNCSPSSASVRSGCSRTQARNCSLTTAVIRLKRPCRDCGRRSIRPFNRHCRRILRTYSKLTPKRRDNSACDSSPRS